MGSEDKIDVYLGLDVGKGEHHGTAMTPAGNSRAEPGIVAEGAGTVLDQIDIVAAPHSE